MFSGDIKVFHYVILSRSQIFIRFILSVKKKKKNEYTIV
jgi:hypothetical protein